MIVNTVWCAGVGFKGMAAYRMVRSKLISDYLLVWLYLLFMVIQSITLIAVRSHWVLYLRFYSLGIAFGLLFKFGAVTCIFWALTSNYRDFRTVGTGLLAIFALFGTIAALLTSFVWVDRRAAPFLWDIALVTQRYANEVILVMLLFTRYLLVVLKSPRTPIPRTAQLAAFLMAFDAATAMFCSWFARAFAYSMPNAVALVTTMQGVFVGAAWLAMRRMEEEPVYVPSPEEVEASRAVARNSLHLIRSDLDYTFRELRRHHDL